MWFLIATDHLSKAKNKAGKAIPTEQRLEAERRAAEWLRKTRGIGPASVDTPGMTARASLA